MQRFEVKGVIAIELVLSETHRLETGDSKTTAVWLQLGITAATAYLRPTVEVSLQGLFPL